MLKFKSPLSADEQQEAFELIEVRGDKVLVSLVNSGMAIVPTFVYLAADLEQA